jgi:hypothetical protein
VFHLHFTVFDVGCRAYGKCILIIFTYLITNIASVKQITVIPGAGGMLYCRHICASLVFPILCSVQIFAVHDYSDNGQVFLTYDMRQPCQLLPVLLNNILKNVSAI